MSDRSLRPSGVAAAAVLIGGVLVLFMPQHGSSILRFVIATAAAGAGLYALGLNAPPMWWTSPFDRPAVRRATGHFDDEIGWIRSVLSGRRQRVTHGQPLPPGTIRLLQPLIRNALDLDRDDAVDTEAVRGVVSPVTFAVLCTPPLTRPSRFRTVRPDAAATADVVQTVLDDLDRLASGRPLAPESNHT